MDGLLGGIALMGVLTSIVYIVVAVLVPVFIWSMNSKLGRLVKEQQRTNQILNYIVEQGKKEDRSSKSE